MPKFRNIAFASRRDRLTKAPRKQQRSPGSPTFEGLESRKLLATTEPFLLGLRLVNADTNKPIIALTEGVTVNLDDLGTQNLSIRAEVYMPTTESVKFGFDGNPNHRVENQMPFALEGDNGGDYLAWVATPGMHSVTATPFSLDGAKGVAGTPITVNFNVLHSTEDEVIPAWNNQSVQSQTGTFTTEFDASVDRSGADVVMGLSKGSADAWTDLAAIVRFNEQNMLDARDGDTYRADAIVPYTANTNYHFRVVANVTDSQYDVYVTPAGQKEVLLASNLAFRSEQSGVSSLNNWASYNRIGAVTGANLKVTSAPTPDPGPTPNPNPNPNTKVMPDETNTGPFDRSALRVINGVLTISQPGIYENFDVTGGISIYASNVTLRNFVSRDNIKVYSGTNIVMEDGEVYSTRGSDGISGQNMTLRRLNLHDLHDGFRIGSDGNVLIENSYIHDLGGAGGHTDGLQVLSDVPNVTLRGNHFEIGGITSALNGVGGGWVVDGNWFNGGQYTMYCYNYGTPEVTNNVFWNFKLGTARFWPSTGIWTGNVDGAGTPIV